ncbi:hypothetical protein LXL04_023061 [Taraxacum kok-saghyz]
MEATVSQSLRLTTWTNSENTVPKLTNSMRLYTRFEKNKNINMLKCNHLGTIKPAIGHRSAWLKASCTSQNSPASVLKSETSITEEDLLLKKKCEEIKLGVSKNRTENQNRTNNRKNRNRKNRNRDNNRKNRNRKNRTETVTITAKTATAKTEPQPKPQPHRKTLDQTMSKWKMHLSCWNDRIRKKQQSARFYQKFLIILFSTACSDKLIEQAARGIAVADIFKLYGKGYFRDNETEVLHKLSLMHGLVISTSGGAVVRPINWKYMHKGITVFIDVPLDTLAQRLTGVGTRGLN